MMAKHVEESYMIISKIGAKVTECWLVKDRLPALKTMKLVAPRTTLQNQTSPLKILVENGLSKLRDEGRLTLPKRKYDAIVDVVSTSPEVYGAAYGDSAQIKKYCVEYGYVDVNSYSCPDIQGNVFIQSALEPIPSATMFWSTPNSSPRGLHN
jgi:hypothetical protein